MVSIGLRIHSLLVGVAPAVVFGGCQAKAFGQARFTGKLLVTMGDDNSAVVQSLVSVVRDAIRRNAATVNNDNEDDFLSVLSATRSALRRRSS